MYLCTRFLTFEGIIMSESNIFTTAEKQESIGVVRRLLATMGPSLKEGDRGKLHQLLRQQMGEGGLKRGFFGIHPVLHALRTADIAVREIGLRRDGVIAITLYPGALEGLASLDDIREAFGESVAHIIRGLIRVQELYKRNPTIESENFRNLLITFSEDMRVILIMIADRVNLMRQIRDCPDTPQKREVSMEASYLYAPLAHKLGLYKLKSELEDLSMKYLEPAPYYHIKEKLNATKAARDAYVARFIAPLEERLKEAGLHFHLKARTKSIHSIWQKMKKQQCEFEGVYDLFAIRVILDSPADKEKMQCWQVFSIVTDMYQPNPKRLRDWLSVPKSNGYESLHITVLGPENKWVEVQIRTERMDEVAEHGLAAHWRYKGVKSEGGIDEWLANIRAVLEGNDNLQIMDEFKMDLAEDEVYVFTPKGDLLKFPKGATVLDFAYYIHSGVGNACVGGRVNGRAVSFREPLRSGDQVEIITQASQQPRREWLNIVKTSKAKNKIRLALKETQQQEGKMAREMLERRLKNRKIDNDEATMARTIKRLGYKENSDFYRDVAEEKVDVNTVIEKYLEEREREQAANQPKSNPSAEKFAFENPEDEYLRQNDDVLTIDKDLKGVDYQLAKCCHPIYGDPIFGFVTVSGGIKIHRQDCPNAPELRRRFGYRIVKAQWSGKGKSQYAITLRVIGNDDIGIVSNITNIISKEDKLSMRSINISSQDGLFSGNVVIMVEDASKTASLIKKLSTVKGVKQVIRL